MLVVVGSGVTSPSTWAGSLRFWAVELSGISVILGVGQIGPWCSIRVCQSKTSFSSSKERLTFSMFPAPSDCFDFGWVVAEKLAGCVVVGRSRSEAGWWGGLWCSCWAWWSSTGAEGSACSDVGGGWHNHLDRRGVCNLHLSHALFSGPARLLHGILVCWAGRYNSNSAESGDDAREIENTFVALFRFGLEVWAADAFWVLALNIPLGALLAQLILDYVKVFILEDVYQCVDARPVVGQVQNANYCGGVGRHSPASHGYGVIAVSIIGIEFHDSVQICSGWLSCKAKPSEIIQPLVNDRFQALVL
ncbi:hypothetical protein V6N13_033623 [Hibiscus sabdariffa]